MSRDISLDILRGLMLVIMAADHFGEPVFQHLYEFAGYVSAAEGFVFLSGMLVALVYGRYHKAGGMVLESRIWHRTGVIYLYHLMVLIAVFVFTVLTDLSGASWQSFATEMQAEPARGLLSGILLTYQAPMLDVLPLYVILMSLAPFALRWMTQYGTVGVLMVLGSSISLWWMGQHGLGDTLQHLLPKAIMIRNGAFHLLAWQMIFVLGMVLGFLRFDSKDRFPQVKTGWFVLSIGTIAFLYLMRHGYLYPLNSQYPILEWLQIYPHTARDSMGWLRLLNFLAIVYFVAGVIKLQRQYGILNWLKLPGHWLAFLGQHSLQVFAYHLVVLYCYIPFRWGEWALSDNQKWVLLPVFIASLSLPAWWHARYMQGKKDAARKASTAVLPATGEPLPVAG